MYTKDIFSLDLWSRQHRLAGPGRWRPLRAPPVERLGSDGPGVIYSNTPFTFVHLTHDLAVLTSAAADEARAPYTDPRWASIAVHAGCKFYAGDLPLGLARSLRGLSADCRLRLKGGLVSNGPEVSSIFNLLKHHGTFYSPRSIPGSSNNEFALGEDFKDRLARWMFA